jgi:hypothetical protein
MRLPFTVDQFLDVFGAYNASLWPVAVVLWLASAHMVLDYYRQRANVRLSLGLLAAQWLWAGAVYHWLFFSSINTAAWLFGGLFVVEGLAFAWLGKTAALAGISTASPARRILALGLMTYALLYPALVLLGAHSYPRVPTFGVPCPTTLLTAGFLIGAAPLPRAIAIIPVLWAVVAGTAAFLLGVSADVMLFVAAAAVALDQLAALRPSAPASRPAVRTRSCAQSRRYVA